MDKAQTKDYLAHLARHGMKGTDEYKRASKMECSPDPVKTKNKRSISSKQTDSK